MCNRFGRSVGRVRSRAEVHNVVALEVLWAVGVLLRFRGAITRAAAASDAAMLLPFPPQSRPWPSQNLRPLPLPLSLPRDAGPPRRGRSDRFQYTIMLLMIRAARFVHQMSVLSPELSRYHANDAEIVTRSPTKTWSFTQKCTKTTGHDSFQYAMMQLVMLAARFVHHVWVLSPELSRYHSRTVKFHPARR